MRQSNDLLGRRDLVQQVQTLLQSGRSVLLFGPEGVGKSATVSAVASDRCVIVDPFEHVSHRRACQLRRALERGVVHLAASRVAHGRELGAVGRILWRFSTVRVRELPDAVMRRIVRDQVHATGDAGTNSHWIRDIVALSQGRPGFAVAMARVAVEWWNAHGYLPMPPLAFAAAREDAVIRTLRGGDGKRSSASLVVNDF